MNILINGLGNIGNTILSIIKEYKESLQVDEIYLLKNIKKEFEDYSFLENNFTEVYYSKEEIPINKIDFVFDCTSNSMACKNKDWYKKFPNLKGATAQGSEHDFGTSYMYGINHNDLINEKYFHIVSCNTHGILSTLKHFGGELNNIEEADFVVVRRSEDLGNHARLVSANVVSNHKSEKYGTHHAEDASKLLNQMGINTPLFSSDITTPSQLMHGLRFNIKLKTKRNQDYNTLIGKTKVFDSNIIFEQGRRYGLSGRLYYHSIIVNNNLHIEKNKVIGWAFVPQEGNTILSTLATLVFKKFEEDEAKKIMNKIVEENSIKTSVIY